MAYLAYQLPNKTVKIYTGEWISGELENIPEDCFFVTDFTKEKLFYFVVQQELSSLSDVQFSFNNEEDVFAVNGRSYLFGLKTFIEGFESNGIEKAIYSRIKLVEKEKEDIGAIFNRLTKKYKQEAFVYLISDEKFGTWMGATPEVLLSGNKEQLYSMALAGTKEKEDISWTKKEEEEHQYVVEYIKEKIDAQSPQKLEISPTETVKRGAVFHLQTNYNFQLSSDKWSSLIQTLHPTPAVCGTPAELAQDYILKLEPHDREFYTGIIGRKGKNNLDIYVNLRCMQILEKYYALYVGGGITLDSDIAQEWQETENKSNTLLSVIFEDKVN